MRIGISVLYGLLAPVSFLFAILGAAFSFDAPGSGDSFLTKLYVLSMLLFPLTLLVSAVGGLGCSIGTMTQGKIKAGKVFLLLPLFHISLFFIEFALLALVCNGNFVC